MSAVTFAFDRLAYIDRLKSGGIDEEHARAHAGALETALRDGVATRSDLVALGSDFCRDMGDLRRDLREVEVRLEAKIDTSAASVKVDVLRWLAVTQAALGGLIFAVLKFPH